MIRLSLIVVIVLATSLASIPASASACVVDKYLHNGSHVEAQVCGAKMTITYTNPGQDLVAAGVTSGTMLFTGTAQANGNVIGHVQVLDANCGAIAFAVSGFRHGGSMILNGNVPVRDAACRIVRHQAIELGFVPQGGAGQNVGQGVGQEVGRDGGNSAGAQQPATLYPRQVQVQLKRVGCLPGAVDGAWGRGSRAALSNFYKRTGLGTGNLEPTRSALNAVESTQQRVCPKRQVSRPKTQAGKKVSKRRGSKRKKTGGQGGVGIFGGGILFLPN